MRTPTEDVIRVHVDRKTVESDGVVSLRLAPVSGSPLPHWHPGAHVDLLLQGLPVRQYSLSGDPEDPSAYRVAVLREADGGGVSLFIHDRLAQGDEIGLLGPRNHFRFVPAPRYRFIAGGIGITPLLPMIAAAEAAGADWRLLYGGRTRASMAFVKELAGYGDRVDLRPQDEFGLLDLDALLGSPEDDTLVYACGPEPLLAAVEARMKAWPPGSLHLERFAPKPLTGPDRAGSFEVVLARSGRTLVVPADRSILSMAEEAGVPVLSSCAHGTCGTCDTPVLEGIPDHRDSVLTEDERAVNDCMMICVSRARSDRLVLNL